MKRKIKKMQHNNINATQQYKLYTYILYQKPKSLVVLVGRPDFSFQKL